MPARSKFTAAVRESLLETKRLGAPDTLACAGAGVSTDSLARWLDKGRSAEGESLYRKFYLDYEAAKAAPKIRSLGLLSRDKEDNPMLNWRYIERQVEGYAPPLPNVSHAQPQVQIHLTLGGSALPLPNWIEGEVLDGEESPALGDGRDTVTPIAP